MTDDTTRSGHADRDFIRLEQEHEVRHWTEALGVSEEVLRDAVRSVGNSAGRVRQYLSYAGSVF